ncbi:uracil-DNA glycosylase [Aquabacterium sp.]|uniref:uracil-DNA glycosylase n=1 Tax=Aquabacterium sp. TaxID=1872578 RepID=UPI0025C5E456|nr:uracil-DNA glycosylase [Aquabacterium sp.]
MARRSPPPGAADSGQGALFGEVPGGAVTELTEPGSVRSLALATPLAALFDAVPPDWRELTEAFRRSPSGQALIDRVDAARAAGEVIFPDDVFAALRLTRRAQVRVVILGQDPYHGPGQAHGLAFSVRPGVAIPPSLRNMRKELQRDLGLVSPAHGSLLRWADQGVLLLNTVLTVAQAQAASHAKWGWEALTDALISALAADPGPRVFLLWGAHAQRKLPLIEATAGQGGPSDRHLILQSNHPSPLSATRGPVPYVGNGHFGRAAAFWRDQGQDLDWSLA